MRPHIVLRTKARAQIVEAYNYLNLAPNPRGEEFLASIDARLEDLAVFPFANALLFGEVRRAFLKPYAYQLLYSIQDFEEERRIVILGCVHERSNPQSWRKLN